MSDKKVSKVASNHCLKWRLGPTTTVRGSASGLWAVASPTLDTRQVSFAKKKILQTYVLPPRW
jgi:hypothetical protein